jgi:tRNA(Arg) A34 adenosine deaminase TadA
MRDDFLNAWETLELPWRESLELAWQSCAAGTVGVGSVITDSNGAIVARGRNRVYDGRSGTEILRDTPIAHAEMNAFATLSSSLDLTKHTLWSSQRPCPLCAAAAVFMHVGTVRFLAADPFFQGVERLPELNPFLAERWPRYDGPTNEDRWAVTAMLLQLSAAASRNPGGSVVIENRKIEPETTGLIEDIVARRLWSDAANKQAAVTGALEIVWPQILDVAYRRKHRRHSS